MKLTVELKGLNLEKLLGIAAQSGMVLRRVTRIDDERMSVQLYAGGFKVLSGICERFGWELRITGRSRILRLADRIMRRPLQPAALALCVVLVMVSSGMIWRIEIEHAGSMTAEVQRYLMEADIRPGTLKRSVPVAALREALLLRLPDAAQVSVVCEGSTLLISCYPALTGEQNQAEGMGTDLVAGEDGVITRLIVQSGTPAVRVGQAVCKGDVLIRGEERGEKQSVHAVRAQGEVTARVWARGDARISRFKVRTVETGALRRRVSLSSPWVNRVTREAEPFEQQDVSIQREAIIGLFIPIWRQTQWYAQTEVFKERRDDAEAASMAQAAAEQMAKNKCPPGAQILDKWVEYSMIDNEYVYATVVLEYESGIAVRAKTPDTGED